jgi:predicted N-acetyltransferase YhbS
VFVAAWGGAIVGCCALEDHGDHWVLEHLWIEPASQGQGIGRSLVEYALAVVSAVRPGAVRLTADPFAVPFYRRLGARPVGQRAAPMPGAPERTLTVLAFEVAGFGAADAVAGSVIPFN